ncbi:ATP-dependent DEAH-box RNA helicase, putative [Trypanosoma brucei brucei TREU927]|uniref:ATP-dependent DEAH-box RNA helicase, putative n=1 Tax=Trypanosoma brucei brucei (strain 927/4 GUTat10.1) TaxID=185431 RepID=Q583S9_TRYB2|nr:ATP-dependent DEAH-box RNA helicase, putative [Trypanosoma brucei brucei TREU927]AAX80478.1 ATP-dependent DEAH-box RNA helicase, putative [Trypanosoma brucei]AAZ11638.1 ATP-dependent DEAH-box RNA helicase, putative [Trypanosoma brucei brucei TREU927]
MNQKRCEGGKHQTVDANIRRFPMGGSPQASQLQQMLPHASVRAACSPGFFPPAPMYGHPLPMPGGVWWPPVLLPRAPVQQEFTNSLPRGNDSRQKCENMPASDNSDTKRGVLDIVDNQKGIGFPENFKRLKKHLQSMVKAFVDDPTAHELSFPPTLSAAGRQQVHKFAHTFGLFHKSSGSQNERFLTLRKFNKTSEEQGRQFLIANGVRVRTEGYQGAQRLPDEYIRPKVSNINLLVGPLLKRMFRDLKLRGEQRQGGRQLTVVQPGLGNVPTSKVPRHRYAELQRFRVTLPAFRQQGAILNAVKISDIVVISGDTGCGKTTQIPQMLYDAGIFNKDLQIVCTQPRRVSALSVAQRVSEERGEACGNSCGYIIRFDNITSSETRIVYMTTGILLRRLRTDPQLSDVSCLIVDEVHERDVETDFCLLLLRDRIIDQRRNPGAYANHIKVVVMSATIQVEKIISYFSGVTVGETIPVIKIPGTLHPVRECYMEDVLQWLQMPLSTLASMKLPNNALSMQSTGNNTEDMAKRSVYEKIKEAVDTKLGFDSQAHVPYDIVVKLIGHIHRSSQHLSESILVFLPGWQAISRVANMIRMSNVSRELSVLQLHSSLTAEEQRRVFYRAPKGYRKVVLSTNIAETSITIDDIVYVVDSCLTKVSSYDPAANTSALTAEFISRANGLQRRGRAGRCRPGVCIHLLPRSSYEALPEFLPPEIMRTPLEEVCLLAKALRPEETCVEVLSRALDVPSEYSTKHATNFLKDIGAFTPEAEQLTSLGRALSRLPVHPLLGKMLLAAACFGVLDPVATIAAFLSGKSPFLNTPNQRGDLQKAVDAIDNGFLSDHMSVLKLFDGWKRSGCSPEYAIHNFADQAVLRSISRTKNQLLRFVENSALLRRTKNPVKFASRHSDNLGLIRLVVLWSLYPRIASLEYRSKRSGGQPEIICWDDKHCQLAATSVLARKRQNKYGDRAFIFFNERMFLETNLTIFDATAVTPVELALCLRELTVKSVKEIPPSLFTDHESRMTPVFPYVPNGEKESENMAALFFDNCKKMYLTNVDVATCLRDVRECMDYYLALSINRVRADLFPEELSCAIAYAIGYPLASFKSGNTVVGDSSESEFSETGEQAGSSRVMEGGNIHVEADSCSDSSGDIPEMVIDEFENFDLTDAEMRQISISLGNLAVFNRYTASHQFLSAETTATRGEGEHDAVAGGGQKRVEYGESQGPEATGESEGNAPVTEEGGFVTRDEEAPDTAQE